MQIETTIPFDPDDMPDWPRERCAEAVRDRHADPEFGFTIGWPTPGDWRPYVMINVWRIRISFGWLWGQPPEDQP